jgi:hypothetical protein
MVMLRLFATLVACLALAPAAGAQTYYDLIGYTSLEQRLGVGNVPNGAGVPVAQVEAATDVVTSGGTVTSFTYAPSATLADGRPGFSLTLMTGPPGSQTQTSGHANGVAGYFWGNFSIAKGITSVDAWEANDWFSRVLNVGTIAAPVSTYAPKVSNHSYIAMLRAPGTNGPSDPGFSAAEAEALLIRSDYLVDRARHVMVVAVGGNTAGPVSAVFGSGYNSIAVGKIDGVHGSGLTTIAGAGRVKPDLVAPESSVSAATPIVAAAAAMLVQTAGVTPFADRPQTIKAVLMAGATKAAFAADTNGPWANTTTRPLDPRFGAGLLNVDNSHRILTAGRQAASVTATVANTGWDFSTVQSGSTERTYFFDVAEGQTVSSFSAVLTWHRQFNENDPSPTFADLNLRLFAADAAFQTVGMPLNQSLSAVDNVEHVWRTSDMAAGRYALVVNGDGSTFNGQTIEYALAWQVIAVPEPGLMFVVVLSMGPLLTRVGRRSPRGKAESIPC